MHSEETIFEFYYGENKMESKSNLDVISVRMWLVAESLWYLFLG